MPVGNGGEAIAITDTSSPALPSCASDDGASVLVIADAVGSKIRGVPGVPQHKTEGVRMVLHPRNQSRYTPPSRVMSRVRRLATARKTFSTAFSSMHANTCTRVCSTIFLAMSRILLICVYGNLTLNISVMTWLLLLSCIGVHSSFSAIAQLDSKSQKDQTTS
jgi:hypothetical protein